VNRYNPGMNAVEKERERCLRCLEVNDPKDGSFASILLARIGNQIRSGDEPVSFAEQLDLVEHDLKQARPIKRKKK
jgi:hypothetical protein